MAIGHVAKLWLVALLVAVALSATVTAATTAAAGTETTAKTDAADDSMAADGAVEKTTAAPQVDPAPEDGPMDDPDEDEDDPPTGVGAAADAGASVGDDVEESVEEDDEEEEEKAGTGKRSVQDTLNIVRGKASSTWEATQKKLKDMFEENKEKFKNTVAGWPDKVKNKFSKLPEDVKTKIFGGNVKGLTKEEISQLNKGQLRMLMPRNNLAGLNQTIQEKVFERFKALNDGQSMRRVLETMNVENKMDLIGKIAEVNAKLGSNERAKERVVMSVVDKLGDPRNWTEAEVDSMKAKGILRHYPPARLTRLNNTALINKITIPSGNEMMRMKPTMQKAWADFILHKKMMAKSVGEWTSADITGDIKSSLGTMPLKTLNMIKNDSLYDAFNSAASTDTKIEPAQGRLIAVKMMSAFKGKSPTAGPAEVKSFVASRLGKLSKFVQPEELVTLLDSSKQDDATVKDVLKNAFSNKQANREKRCEVFKRTEKGKNLATLTAVEVNNLVNDGTLVCVPLKYVNMWVSDSKLTVTKLTPDLLSPGQLRAIARNVSALDGYKKAGGGLDLDKLPPSLISVAQPSDIRAYDWTKLKSKITLGGKFDKAQRAMVVNKGTADQIVDADLGPEYTELIPVADMKGLTPAKKKMAAMAAGPDSALRMLSADDPTEELPKSITPENVDDLYQPGLPFFDAEEVANSISTDNIQAVLEKLREEEDGDEDQSGMGGMSPKMCTMLKKVLSNASKLIFNDDDDDASILGEKSGTELGSLPPCIIGRLSAPVVSDKALPDQKVAIVAGLSNVKPTQLKMLSKRNCHGLVREAIAASKPTGDLMVEQAEMIGMAASCMDSADIRRLDMLAFDSLKMYFKDGCLDKSQADAIVDQLIKYNGAPDTWPTLESMCDLLPLMDDSRLREIPETRLAASCGPTLAAADNMGMARFKKTAQMLCKRQTSEADDRQLMERMANVQTRVARGVMMAQKELMDALDTETPDATATATKTRRRRREADPKLTCAVVEETGQGASPWTVAQLNDMSVAEVKMCRKALGSKKADNDKLTVVWGKLKEAYENDAGMVPIKDVGYTVGVIPTDDIKTLDLSTFDDVSVVGRPVEVSEDQLMELAKRATSEFSGLSVDPTEYESDNLVAAGQLICGMDAANVTKIPNEKIKPAMKTLAEVQWCPSAIKEKLATKSLELNGGDAKSLGKAEVTEMGALVGGLEAMQLKDIPKDAMAGLTAEGMKSIPPSKIAALTADQVSQLSAAAALSVSADQRANLPEDSRTALDAVLEVSVTPKGGAEQVAGALLSTLLLAFAVLRLA